MLGAGGIAVSKTATVSDLQISKGAILTHSKIEAAAVGGGKTPITQTCAPAPR